MRFFDTNWLYEKFGGSYSASSGYALLAFDEDKKYSWASDLQNNDGQQVYVQRDLVSSTKINRIFITKTNIKDLSVQVNLGSGFVALTNFNLIKSVSGENYLFELNQPINIRAIKILGSQTIIANRNKEIGQIMAFMELGRLEAIDDINPRRVRLQKVNKLNVGKIDVINLGFYYQFQLKLKSHYNPQDNAIINSLLNREDSLFFWINDNEESSMVMIQEPYRFEDIYKVAVTGNDNLSFTRNMFFSGIDQTINLEEVA